MKEHDDQDRQIEQDAAQDVFKRGEVVAERQPIKQREGGDACGHGHGARAAQEFQDRIDEDEDQHQVQHVAGLVQSLHVLSVWREQ